MALLSFSQLPVTVWSYTISWKQPVKLATGVATDGFTAPTIVTYDSAGDWMALWKKAGGGLQSAWTTKGVWNTAVAVTSQADSGAAFATLIKGYAFWAYNNAMAYAGFNPTSGWGAATFVNYQVVGTCSRNPGAITSADASAIMVVHEGYKCNGQFYYTFFNTNSFSTDTAVNVQTAGGPGLANSENLQYAFHQGHNIDGNLWYTSYNPASSTWAADTQTTTKISSEPASALVAELNPSIVVLAYQRNGEIYWNAYDGTKLLGENAVQNIEQTIPNGNQGVGVGVFQSTVRVSYIDTTNNLWYIDGIINQ